MKHIRSYKIFESTKDDVAAIRDICYDITDDGEFDIEIIETYAGTEQSKNNFGLKEDAGFVLIKRTDGQYGNRIAFYYKDIKNTTNMIKSYLEDRYIKSMVMLSGDMNWLDLDDRREPYRLIDPHKKEYSIEGAYKDSDELISHTNNVNNNINENGIKYFVIWFKNT